MLTTLFRSRRVFFFFFQAEDGIRDIGVTGVQTCALPISRPGGPRGRHPWRRPRRRSPSGTGLGRSRRQAVAASSPPPPQPMTGPASPSAPGPATLSVVLAGGGTDRESVV